MADFDDLPGFAPPPSRPTVPFPLEAERRAPDEREEVPPTTESLLFRWRVALRRGAASSTTMLLVATVLVGGTVAVTRAARRPSTDAPHPILTAPIGPPRATAEIPKGSEVRAVDEAVLAKGGSATPKRNARKDEFRFASRETVRRVTSVGGGPPLRANEAPGPDPAPSSKPQPESSPPPYTPTSILMRLTHPNGAYFFTTDPSVATHKEGYEGYVSERVSPVWHERRGPTMIRLELSDDSVAFAYARERDVPSGDPMPLYSASTERYGRFYSLDRDEAAQIGEAVIYGWVARY